MACADRLSSATRCIYMLRRTLPPPPPHDGLRARELVLAHSTTLPDPRDPCTSLGRPWLPSCRASIFDQGLLARLGALITGIESPFSRRAWRAALGRRAALPTSTASASRSVQLGILSANPWHRGAREGRQQESSAAAAWTARWLRRVRSVIVPRRDSSSFLTARAVVLMLQYIHGCLPPATIRGPICTSIKVR